MTEKQRKNLLAKWVASRPESVRKLAREFPLGMQIKKDGKLLVVIGWTESDLVILAELKKWQKDYDEAVKERQYAHAECMRGHG